MTLAETLGVQMRFREALALALLVAFLAALIITPRTIRKLLGAGIVGQDRHKAGRPDVPEMGGLAVFLAFNMGAFTLLGFGDYPKNVEGLILASLVVAAGATITGVLDDLVVLRQRFKALIPFAFAIPLALYITDTTITFPVIGEYDFGLAYALLLVPLGVACASNGFNMLEGFNGVGAGLGIAISSTLAFLCIMSGRLGALALLFPLIGALGGFLWFNAYPAKVFPGDTMTLMVGAVIASAAIISKLEFWGALLLTPHIVEFFWKAANGFPTKTWGGTLHENGILTSERETPVGIGQLILKISKGMTESQLFIAMMVMQIIVSLVVIGGFYYFN